MELGKVVRINWESHSVDLVLVMSGRPLNGVRVMSPSASTNTGLNDLATPDLPAAGDPFTVGGDTGTRDIIACVGYFGGLPVVQGFLHPQISQMLFSDKERMVYRHASDVYKTIDKDGNFEFYHPSGAFVRVAVASAHEDLTAKDFDGLWKISRNTDKQVHIHVEQAGGNAIVDIAPNGKVTLTSAVEFEFNGPVHFKGAVTADSTITASGNVKSTDGNLIDSTNKSLADARTVFNAHTHGETGGTTAPPGSSM